MIEILITIAICLFTGFVIFKSIKNSSNGKCSCGDCKHCSINCKDDTIKLTYNTKTKK